jgi:hypothetical protein
VKNKFLGMIIFVSLFQFSLLTSAGPIIDGREWLQPADLTRYSWNDFNAVCSSGLCTGQLGGSGPLLTGYMWATVDDVNALINSYIGSAELTGPSEYTGGSWGEAFFSDFTDIFVNTSITRLDAWTSTAFSADEAYLGVVRYLPDFNVAAANTDVTGSRDLSSRNIGAWLYRPVEAVPSPATLILFVLGLVGLGISRWNHSRNC